MLRHRVSAVPVLDDEGRLVGIVSEGDLMRRVELASWKPHSWWLDLVSSAEEVAVDYVKCHGHQARDVMTKEIVSIEEDTPFRRSPLFMKRSASSVCRRCETVGWSASSAGQICCTRLPRPGWTIPHRATMRSGGRCAHASRHGRAGHRLERDRRGWRGSPLGRFTRRRSAEPPKWRQTPFAA